MTIIQKCNVLTHSINVVLSAQREVNKEITQVWIKQVGKEVVGAYFGYVLKFRIFFSCALAIGKAHDYGEISE